MHAHIIIIYINRIVWFCVMFLSHTQEIRCLSFCVSSVWCSCTGTTTSLFCCTRGTPTEIELQEAAGSSPWTTPCTRSCTATTRRKRPASASLGPAPWSSPPSRLCKWFWVWQCWCLCSAGRTTWCAGPQTATWPGARSCTSATCCSSLPSSTSPTWREGRRSRLRREELKLNSVCWTGVGAVSLTSGLSVQGLNYGLAGVHLCQGTYIRDKTRTSLWNYSIVSWDRRNTSNGMFSLTVLVQPKLSNDKVLAVEDIFHKNPRVWALQWHLSKIHQQDYDKGWCKTHTSSIKYIVTHSNFTLNMLMNRIYINIYKINYIFYIYFFFTLHILACWQQQWHHHWLSKYVSKNVMLEAFKNLKSSIIWKDENLYMR